MPRKNSFNENEQHLTYRYLLWCYKTTKESLERIDRKFTQLEVDYFIRKELKTGLKDPALKGRADYKEQVDKFDQYIDKKEVQAFAEKFLDDKKLSLRPEYIYLSQRLEAITKTIRHFLGNKELKKIISLYEEEFVQRILTAREHT